MILTYEEYKSFGGKLSSTEFNVFGYEAEARIKAQVHGRITQTEAIKRCIVRITELLAHSDAAQDKVTAWSNDGVSESIKSISLSELEEEIEAVIMKYLAGEVDERGVPLLYLGGASYD